MEQFGLIDSNDTVGYECLLPCDFSPCGDDICVDLTENGQNWNEESWAEFLEDTYMMTDDVTTYGYECIFEPPCDFEPCANLTDHICIDLTMNGTVFNESYWIDFFDQEYGHLPDAVYSNETYGYQCIDPFRYFLFIIYELNFRYGLFILSKFNLLLRPPPCWENPCDASEQCLDPTLNGTVWNETIWEDWLWENYRLK